MDGAPPACQTAVGMHYHVSVTVDFDRPMPASGADGETVSLRGFTQIYRVVAPDEDAAVKHAAQAALSPTRPSGFPLEIVRCGLTITEVALARLEPEETAGFLEENGITAPDAGVYWRSGFLFVPATDESSGDH